VFDLETGSVYLRAQRLSPNRKGVGEVIGEEKGVAPPAVPPTEPSAIEIDAATHVLLRRHVAKGSPAETKALARRLRHEVLTAADAGDQAGYAKARAQLEALVNTPVSGMLRPGIEVSREIDEEAARELFEEPRVHLLAPGDPRILRLSVDDVLSGEQVEATLRSLGAALAAVGGRYRAHVEITREEEAS